MVPCGSVWAHIKTGRSHMAQDHFKTPPDPNYPSVTLTRSYLPLGLKPLVEYYWFYVPCFTLLVSHYWFYITGFIFQVWESLSGLVLDCFIFLVLFLALYSWFYIPGFIFLVVYSWFYIPGCIFLDSYSWLYNPAFMFLVYIPGYIVLALYSWFIFLVI